VNSLRPGGLGSRAIKTTGYSQIILPVDYEFFRALKLLCKKNFLTPAELCKELKAMGSSKFTLGDVGKMLNSEIFKQSSAYVFLNPDAALLLSRLLPPAYKVGCKNGR
jgi:hypothetical protein